MLSPLLGFTERDIVGVFKVASASASGLAMIQDSLTDTSPLSPSPYANSFGSLVAASITTALPEDGYLLQPVTTTGPSVFSILASIYDESVAAGTTAALLLRKSGGFIATDQYVSGSGTGAITVGSTSLNTICGIASGQFRIKQSGDTARAIFKGQVTQRATALAMFAII
jgi:hypothetical protein